MSEPAALTHFRDEVPKKIVYLRYKGGTWEARPRGNSLIDSADQWFRTSLKDEKIQNRPPLQVLAAIASDWDSYAIRDEITGRIWTARELQDLAKHGAEICEECSGKGQAECPDCSGTGEIKCEGCYGEGEIELSAEEAA